MEMPKKLFWDTEKMTKVLVIGLDAACWEMIRPNLDKLPNFKKILGGKNVKSSTIYLKEKPHSASVWCSMFSGLNPEEHKHSNFHKNGKILEREDIDAKFIWDILGNKLNIVALQVPFVYPPYNFNCEFTPINYGLITDKDLIKKNLDLKLRKSIEILRKNPDIFIVVFTALDQISHFYWDSDEMIKWYIEADKILERLVGYGEEVIIVSDHGFCKWDESKVHTLPRKTRDGREIKGDHSCEAIVITKNITYNFKKPQDVFNYIRQKFENGK